MYIAIPVKRTFLPSEGPVAVKKRIATVTRCDRIEKGPMCIINYTGN